MTQNTTIAVGVAAVIIIAAIFFIFRLQTPVQEGNDIPSQVQDNAPVDVGIIAPSEEPSMSPSPSAAAPTASAVKEFTVTGGNFKFDPKEIKVKQGDTVRITFKNQSGIHDLKIDEFNVGTKVINGGQEETIEFVANKVGTFEYYCSVANHRQMGMKGMLVVE